MEMSVYEYDALMLSLQNLSLLKLFYDYGVDIKNNKFPDHIENIESGGFKAINISLHGLSEIFEEVHQYSSYEENVPDKYKELLSDQPYDYIYVIKDAAFASNKQISEEEIINKINDLPADDAVIKPLYPIGENGIAMAFDFFPCEDLLEFNRKLLRHFGKSVVREGYKNENND